ncbi:MAG: hypothetical protein ACSW8J_08670, partial [bacterium]
MNDKHLHVLAAVALCVGFAALHVLILLTALHVVGTDSELYYTEQLKANILPRADMCDAALRTLDGSLARYLKGDAAALIPG